MSEQEVETHPVQTRHGPRKQGRAPKVVTMAAYEVYCHVYSPQEALVTGGCRGGFAGGELFRVGRYVSTGAREVVRDFERKMRHCVRRREKSFSSFLFRFRGNCGKVSPGGLCRDHPRRLC